MATVVRAFSLKAHAKLNLRLEVGPRIGPVHQIMSVIAEVDLCDVLHFAPSAAGFSVSCDVADIPEQENLVWRAAHALSLPLPHVNIEVSKHIPAQAGLGGGSADAAAALRGLARIFNDNGAPVSRSKLVTAAGRTGSDVTSCLVPGLKIISGVGDKLRVQPWEPPAWGILLLQPKARSSTTQAYRLLDEQGIPHELTAESMALSEAMCAAVVSGDFNRFSALLYSDFSAAVERSLPETAEARLRLERAGAQASILCGSGSCVAGFFETHARAVDARHRLHVDGDEWATVTGFASGN